MKKNAIALILAASLIGTYIPVEVFATGNSEIESFSERENKKYVNGTYTVANSTLRVDSDAESSARKYVTEESKVSISKDGIKATLEFTEKTIMTNIRIKVNGQEVSYSQKETGDKSIEVEFDLNSLEDEIEVSTVINMGFHVMDVSFRVLLDTQGIETMPDVEEDNTGYTDGTYIASNSTLRVDSDTESSARKYVTEQSKVIISKDEIKATLEFTEKTIMTNIRIKVNGQEVAYTQKETGEKSIEVEFPLNSLEDNIEVATTINLGFHAMDVSFRVLLDTQGMEKAPDNSGNSEKDDSSNNTPSEEDKNTSLDNNSGNNNESSSDSSNSNSPSNSSGTPTQGTDSSTSNGVQAPTATENTNTTIYKIQNEILSSSAIGYKAARAAVSSTSYIEVIDGITYVTLGLSQLDVMTNIKVSVDGKNVSYETVRSSSSNNTKDIRFKVASISSSITLSAYITASDMNISFGVDLLESTKQQISKTEASQSLGISSTLAVTSSSSLGTTSSNSANSSSYSGTGIKSSIAKSGDDEENDSEDNLEVEATEYFKKYTIENEVVSDSAIGKMMVKKYLDSTSLLEEIDGRYYLTLTFVGTSAMDNIKIMVNGTEVEYSMKNISDDDKGTSTFKFEISNVNDEITMSMLIVPIGSTIEFGISLLEDTMVLVEEGIVSKEEMAEEESSIQTLTSLNTTSNNGGTSIFKTILISTLTTIVTMGTLGGVVLAILGKKRKNIKK